MTPYDSYRLHQIERAKSPAEVQRAGEQAARIASAISSLICSNTRPARAVRRPLPAAARRLPARPDELVCGPAKTPSTTLSLANVELQASSREDP